MQLSQEQSLRNLGNPLELGGLNRINVSGMSSIISGFEHVANGDTNGVFYYLGTNGLHDTWVNPITSGVVSYQLHPTIFFNNDYAVFYSVDRGAASNATYIAEYNTDQRNWLTYDFGSYALKPEYYTIMGRAGYNANFLKNWILEGSNDNSNWDVLDTRVNDTQQGQGIWGEYTATSVKPYRYLRIRSTGVDSSGNNLVGFGEIEFYGTLYVSSEPSRSNTATLTRSSNGDNNGLFYHIGTDALGVSWVNPISTRKVTCYTTSQLGDINYYPYRSVDRGASASPWHNNGDANTAIIYDLGGYRINPTDYTMMGRADYNGLFPRNWVIEGSNDLTNWTTLDTQTAETSQNQGTWGHYTTTSSAEYRYLRVRSTGNDSSGAPWFVIGEIEFYGDISY